MRPDTGQDIDLEDEAALDPEDIIEALLGYDMPPILVPPTQVQDVPDIGKTVSFEATASQSANSSGNITGPTSTADAPMDSSVVSEPIGLEEPSAKRQKMTISRVGHFRYPQVDDTDISMGMDFDFGVFPEESDTGLNDAYDPDYQEGGDDVDFGNEDEERLWWPFSPEEPVLDSALLVELDAIADQLEVTRLQEMSVLVKEEDLSPDVELGGYLTARFVRTWRKKSKGNDDFWYRRSRLVAREFNKLCVRDDLYSPASNHIVEGLVPAMCLSNTFSKAHVLGALDISDAYLQVPQEVPRRISILDGNIHSGLVINKCLPGQRDGSRRWFDHFSSFLAAKLKLSPCLEQPALFKIPIEDGGGALLMHVDDVLFVLDEK